MSFQFFRRFFYEIHLWLGIISGIVIFLVCLSGAILVFYEDVDYLAAPHKYFVNVPAKKQKLPIDEVIAKIEAKHPEMKVNYLTIPEKANRTIMIMLSSPTPERQHGRGSGGHGSGGHGGFAAYYVNPYTGDIVANYDHGGGRLFSFLRSMVELHRNLWISYPLKSLGPRVTLGSLIVGIATIIFVVVELSGLVLWLPRTWKSFAKWRAWKPGFKIRLRKGFWAFVYDIHNTIGFYMLIPALILALTGLCWSFNWYRDAASSILGDQIFKQRMQQPAKIEPVENGTSPFSVGEIIERQNQLTPGSGELIISIPNDNKTAMVIQKGRTGFFALSIKDKTQWDRFRGTVIPVEHFGKMVEVERFADKPLGAKIAVSIRSLHFGDITGTSSKILFFIACVFATTFPITGVALWIRKLVERYKKRRAAKNIPQKE